MLDFNDFQPIEDNPSQNNNLNPPQNENNNFGMDQMNNMFLNLDNQNENKFNPLNQQIDDEEQKRILAREKEAQERKEKRNKKILEEEEKRNEIRKKAAEYLVEFEEKRREEIAKKRKILEENEKKGISSTGGSGDAWDKVKGNIDLKDSEYKGSKDVQRMRDAMLNNPSTQPLKTIFG